MLQEAITSDTRFLSPQSIMDYSLLVGLDHSRKELVVGLVDAIGSFGLFKPLESRGKIALNRGGDVTVVSLMFVSGIPGS
jgi:1-phosphatidylinositol-3-phosphate 5-kinase